MAIGRTFEQSLLKAVRSLETNVYHLELKEQVDDALIQKRIQKRAMNGYFTLRKRFVAV